jgi:hypothetical protein
MNVYQSQAYWFRRRGRRRQHTLAQASPIPIIDCHIHLFDQTRTGPYRVVAGEYRAVVAAATAASPSRWELGAIEVEASRG